MNAFHAQMQDVNFNMRTAAILFVAILLLSGCGKKDQGHHGFGGPAPEVGVMTIEAEAISLTTELPGRLEAVRTSQVRARATGILLKQVYREGADVEEGEVLYEIDPAPLQANLNSAKAALAKAEAAATQVKARAERLKNLVAINAVSKQDYEDVVAGLAQAEADVQSAKSLVETAELNLGYATVRAPISGRIGASHVTEGALVSQVEATPMAVIQQLDPIYLDVKQSTGEVLRLKQQMEQGTLKQVNGAAEVTLILEDGSVYQHKGKLLFSDITVDPSSSMITLRAEFPNPDKLLLPNMFARGRLEQGVAENTITASQRAVILGPSGKATVMVVGSDNKVEMRPVVKTQAIGDKWIITEGLKPGERVIVEGLQKAQPGAEVKPVPVILNKSGK